jgi:hypothetical protein
MYYMFQPKRPSSGTRALTTPLFFPPAMPPYTGQCLQIGSQLDGGIVLVMPLYSIYCWKKIFVGTPSLAGGAIYRPSRIAEDLRENQL